jgi:Group II intron, maturase-specific domain
MFVLFWRKFANLVLPAVSHDCTPFSHRGVIADLNPLLRGWAGYFGFSQWRELASLDGWIRRRWLCQ